MERLILAIMWILLDDYRWKSWQFSFSIFLLQLILHLSIKNSTKATLLRSPCAFLIKRGISFIDTIRTKRQKTFVKTYLFATIISLSYIKLLLNTEYTFYSISFKQHHTSLSKHHRTIIIVIRFHSTI